jgi:hypothetical protein
MHGPYPAGNAVAQPDLHAVFPDASANDQTFRLILKPNLWSRKIRLRFSNVLGSRPIQIDGVYAGVHASAGRLLAGTNRPVRFGGRRAVTIEPGRLVWSDAVDLDHVYDERKMAVSFHAVGESGPMTWHAKAMQTSYLSRPYGARMGRKRRATRFRSLPPPGIFSTLWMPRFRTARRWWWRLATRLLTERTRRSMGTTIGRIFSPRERARRSARRLLCFRYR